MITRGRQRLDERERALRDATGWAACRIMGSALAVLAGGFVLLHDGLGWLSEPSPAALWPTPSGWSHGRCPQRFSPRLSRRPSPTKTRTAERLNAHPHDANSALAWISHQRLDERKMLGEPDAETRLRSSHPRGRPSTAAYALAPTTLAAKVKQGIRPTPALGFTRRTASCSTDRGIDPRASPRCDSETPPGPRYS